MNRVTTVPGIDPARVTVTFERLFELLRRLTADSTSLTAASTLRRLDQFGDHRLSDLAIAEGVTQPAMTQLVSRLERGGLVARAGDRTDGRVVVVCVTDAGRELVRRRRQVRTARLAELLTDLSPADRAAIIAALPALDRLSGSAPRSTDG
jgi:DNA-binding MarR family transcriptional regulator